MTVLKHLSTHSRFVKTVRLQYNSSNWRMIFAMFWVFFLFSAWLSDCFFVHLFACPTTWLFVCLAGQLTNKSTGCPSVQLDLKVTHLPVGLFAQLTVHLLICLSNFSNFSTKPPTWLFFYKNTRAKFSGHTDIIDESISLVIPLYIT